MSAKLKKYKKKADKALKQAEAEQKRLQKERDDALKAAQTAQAKVKKRKKKAKKHKKSDVLDRKLDKLAQHLEVDFEGIESDSSDEEVQRKKPKEDPKSEFTLQGIKKIPAEFNGMSGKGIRRHLRISATFRNKIARNEFFELAELYKFISAKSLRYKSPLDTESSARKANEPQTKTEVFELLYLFGMFYLQVFPEKMLGFLDHCSYLTTCSKTYHVPGLLRLDSALRELYITNPEWNWSQDHYEVIDVRTAFANDDSVKMSKVKDNKQAGKSKYEVRGQQFSTGNPSYSRGRASRGRGGSRGRPRQARLGEKCDRFNRGECNNPNCGREHICYCGEAGHNALNCPKLTGNRQGAPV